MDRVLYLAAARKKVARGSETYICHALESLHQGWKREFLNTTRGQPEAERTERVQELEQAYNACYGMIHDLLHPVMSFYGRVACNAPQLYTLLDRGDKTRTADEIWRDARLIWIDALICDINNEDYPWAVDLMPEMVA